ncbi:type I polyketide synthase [Dactylosporangium sp. CA-233914]|uniref:type I polyketide synthase n=1 Tax=Dactylosporangium sp. CA-233914 TaxID=3239934 RepID=UPI003D91C37D
MASPDRNPGAGDTLRRAYLAMEQMQRRLDEYEQARSEPIAVVGIGCRFPGGVSDTEGYWQILSDGADVVAEIPADRWDAEAFHSTEPQQPGRMSTRWGGFLDRVDEFDHDFFGISRREAVTMDPQQRLTLEVAWEALENAGLAPAELAGRRGGVFLGVCSYDFAAEHFQHPLDLSAYASTGTSHSVVAGRLSYLLDLRGPSLTVDSACSSSLVAVHLAAQSLRSGECDLALSGGVNVVVSPLPSIAFSQFPGMVSPDGRCKTFDARADGYVRSEGCGVVVLKRLADARRDGDRILALVRGGAVNQDGRSSGVTAPNGAAQRDVLRAALASAGVGPERVGYIEAHGTGTRLGDPIEVEALADVYGRADGPPVYLGSSKTNIGHAEAAAGIAGLIKAVLCVQRGAIPQNVHFTELNPHISFAGTTFAVPTALTPWPDAGGPRIAGVSSFGFSGTNAHLIVEQPPAGAEPEAAAPERPQSVLALSAKTPAALTALARGYAARLAAGGGVADLCYSANTGRSHFRHRLAAVGADAEEIAEKLADFADGLPGDEPATGEAGTGEVVFLFTGQGPQRVGMARELYRTQPTFRELIDRCDEILRPELETPLLSVLYPADPDSSPINETIYSQPALFAVEYSLAQLWRSWGVEPAAVLGHSFGEYVAACVAGAMSLEDGLWLAAQRGRLMHPMGGTGSMAAIFAPEEQVADAIAGYPDAVSIAAVNGPANTAISGERAAVAEICAAFTARGVEAKLLHIGTASHSPLVEPILEPLRRAAERVTFGPTSIPLVSNLTGELWPWERPLDADYWVRHARRPVRFAAGVATLLGLRHRTFLESGPAPTLLGLVRDGAGAGPGLALLPSLRPKHPEWPVLLSTLAQLYARGVPVDWRGFDRQYRRSKTALPTYPFQRTRCWPDPRPRLSDPAGPQPAEHDPDDDGLLYRLDWQPAPATDAAGAEGARPAWLILDDGEGIGESLAAALTARGERCVRAGGDEIPDVIADVAGDEPLNVVHLWGLRIDEEPADVDGFLRGQDLGCMSAVRAVQALAARPAGSVQLWLVTRGAVSAGGHRPAAGQATLWGLGRSLQQEQPALWGALIDLDPAAAPAAAAQALLTELDRRGGGEDQVALRGDGRLVARLVRAEAPARPAALRPDGTYLITGGLGGIGLAVARSLAAAGARRLVLAGRTGLPPRREWTGLPGEHPAAARVAAVREIEALGASVTVELLDVADEAAARAFLERYEAEGWPPIRGVVHAAGVGEIAPLTDLTPEDLHRHLRPKAAGAWVLHRLFADRPLDFLVLFSSTSSLLSSPFVAAYAAANAYLDALAALRRHAGQPGLSIDWGIWAGTGLAARDAGATPGLSRGMGQLAPGQALRVFHRLLAADAGHVAVAPVDWAEWGRRYQEVSGSALLGELLAEAGGRRTAGRVTAPRASLPSREALLALPADARRELLVSALLVGVAATLGGVSSVGPDQRLSDLGLDSLMAVELRNEVERGLGVSLPISVLLEGASVRTLAEHIVAVLPAGDAAAPVGAAAIPRARRFDDVAGELLAELEGSAAGAGPAGGAA